MSLLFGASVRRELTVYCPTVHYTYGDRRSEPKVDIVREVATPSFLLRLEGVASETIHTKSNGGLTFSAGGLSCS